jgi:hypothetical protein
MGEVEVGDCVFSETGAPCSVLAVSPVMYGRRVLEVRFDDGTAIRADADHLWITMTAGERESAMRRTEAFRARRRETRPGRGTGKRQILRGATTSKARFYLILHLAVCVPQMKSGKLSRLANEQIKHC